MIAKVQSFVLRGVDALPCEIEADIDFAASNRIIVVGLPDAAVKESVERVRAAIVNCGYRFPGDRITLNLAPADLRKEGPVYDLPFAVSILMANRTIHPGKARPHNESTPSRFRLDSNGTSDVQPTASRHPHDHPRPAHYLIAGELALDGRVRPIKGAISLAMLAARMNVKGVLLPVANAREAAVVHDVRVLGVDHINQVVAFFNGLDDLAPHPPIEVDTLIRAANPDRDFGEIRGQEPAKRGVTIAAAGGHNMLMLGPPGTGKTMMAKALPGILPPLSRDEALEVTRIYSSIGRIPPDQPIMVTRPVRMPHHTATAPAIIGGGSVPRPGDVSLAHRGILFLDELPEFSRHVLETLRQPLEDGVVTIARAQGSVRFPARFMLVAALNPTPKGTVDDGEAGQRAVDRYLARISGPLIDRIDMHLEVPAIPYRQLTGRARGTDTSTMRTNVAAVRQRQHARQGPLINSELSSAQLDAHARTKKDAAKLIEDAMTDLGLSARAYDKIRRVARTIADLDDTDVIQVAHVAEAIQYRLLDRKR